MKRVNLCAASIPHTPCALTRALAHALRQSASNVIDARLTQPTQAGSVRAKLNGSLPFRSEIIRGARARYPAVFRPPYAAAAPCKKR